MSERIFLPTGDKLKALLSQSKVSKTELKNILRSRGVFFGNDEKEYTAPILIKTLLSPSEYSDLKEKIKTKEENIKTHTRTLEWNSKETLIDAFHDNMELNSEDIISDPFSNYQLHDISDFYVQGNDNSIALDFTIKRTDSLSNWDESERYFSGKIEINKKDDTDLSDNVFVNILLRHTSPETKSVSDKLLKMIKNNLEKNGHIKSDAKINKIQFDHFSNENRILFLKDIAKEHREPSFYFDKIVDISFCPDDSSDNLVFPESVKWLEKDIEELKLKGSLEESIFVKNKDLHPYLKVFRLVASYKIQDVNYDSICRISFEFQEFSTKRREDAELLIDFRAFTSPHKDPAKTNTLKSDIMKMIENVKENRYLALKKQ